MSTQNPKDSSRIKGIARARKLERQEAADARQAERNKRTPLEQAQLLVERPGHSFKETARLAEEMI